MTELTHLDVILEKTFDSRKKRHYINGHGVVMHCHHYMSLYTQLALDARETDLLADVAEETFYELLGDYYAKHGTTEVHKKVKLAEQYYAALGLGVMQVTCLGCDSGEVVLTRAHVDEGWLMKWGRYDKPVNYVTAGYVAALFALTCGMEPGSYAVKETASIVMGEPRSRFTVVKGRR